jgi:hypothetical protein
MPSIDLSSRSLRRSVNVAGFLPLRLYKLRGLVQHQLVDVGQCHQIDVGQRSEGLQVRLARPRRPTQAIRTVSLGLSGSAIADRTAAELIRKFRLFIVVFSANIKHHHTPAEQAGVVGTEMPV